MKYEYCKSLPFLKTSHQYYCTDYIEGTKRNHMHQLLCPASHNAFPSIVYYPVQMHISSNNTCQNYPQQQVPWAT
jgi:hypothetical protein